MGCLSKSVLMMVIFLLTFSNVYAQSNPLTLKECVQMALDNSSRIIIAKRSLDTAELEVKDVRAGYLPRLDATTGYKVNNTYNKIEWTQEHYDVRLSLTETFYDNGKTPAKTKQAKDRLESAHVDFQKIKNEVAFEVAKGYYNLLYAQKMCEVKYENMKQAQTHLDLAKARFDVGVVPKSDILKTEVEVSNAELGLIGAENTLSLAQADLNNCLGIDLNPPLLILESLTSLTSLTGLTEDECLTYALKNRPEIRKAEINLQIDEISLKLAQKEILPSLYLEGGYNTDVDQLIDKHDWNESTGWEIGLKMSLPIFDAGKAKRGVTKANINLANTKTDADQLKKEIVLGVKKAYLTLKSQEKMIEIAKRQVVQAQESCDTAQGRYKSGVAPIIEVIDAQASLNQAKVNLIKAVYDYNIVIFTLKKTIGGEIVQVIQ